MAILREDIKFLAELFRKSEYDPRLATASKKYERIYNIYSFSIAALVTDTSNWWVGLGGYYDNPTATNIQIYMNLYLTEAETEEELLLLDNSFYLDIPNKISSLYLPGARR